MNRFCVCVCLSLLGALVSLPLAADTVLRCQDAQGNVFFADQCPGAATTLEKRQLNIKGSTDSPSITQISNEHPIVFYSVAECDACDLLRSYLQKRELPFAEKDVSDDPESQAELKERAGAYTVPVVLIGEHVVKGYNRPSLQSKLSEVGYPDPEAPPEAETEQGE